MRTTGSVLLVAVAAGALALAGVVGPPGPGLGSAVAAPLDSVAVARAHLSGISPAAVPGAALRLSGVEPVGSVDVVRFQQVVSGLPVIGGESVVAVRRAVGEQPPIAVTAAEVSVSGPVSTGSRISAGAARQAALAQARGIAGLEASTPALWVFDPRLVGAPGDARPRVVWRVEVSSSLDASVRRLVLVDAVTGKVALALDQAQHLERWVCDNEDDPTAGSACEQPVRREGAESVGRDDIDAAYSFAGDTARFLARVLGRSGIDGRSDSSFGGVIRSTVRYCPADPAGTDCPYANAFWNGEQMVYGSGYASAQDVVAHELVHGVTQYGPRLFYYHQSGAINESISDSLGELADLWARSSTGDVIDTDLWSVRWQMGEDLPGGAVRSLSRPTVDRMTSSRFVRSEDDLGGVHENSGVGNKFTSLVTDGGTFNGRTVRAIGVPKAAQLVYAASQLLTSGADYRAYARALDAACRSLIGDRLTTAASVFTASDCDQVRTAIAAVQMRVPVGPRTVALCPRGTAASRIFTEGFEQGSGRWSTSGLRDWYHSSSVNPYGFDARYAAVGRGSMWGNNGTAAGASALAMRSDVRLPRAVPGVRLAVRFSHAYGFWPQLGRPTSDGGVVEYSVDSGRTWRRVTSARWAARGGANGYSGTIAGGSRNPLAGAPAFVGHSGGYVTSRFDVTDLAGRTLRLRFRMGQVSKPAGDSGDLGWFLDDIAVVACR